MNDKFSALKRKIALKGQQKEHTHKVVPVPEQRYQPFPLNDMQRAYWLGRSTDVEGGNIGMQCFMEFAVSDFNEERFNKALNLLVQRHDMLRAIVLPNGTQHILETPPAMAVRKEDLKDLDEATRKQQLKETADAMWREVSDLGQWPQHDFRFSVTAQNGSGILHIKLDMWCLDGRSIQIFMEDLVAFYQDPDAQLPSLEITFKDYLKTVSDEEQSEKFQRDLAYWKKRLKTLPPPPNLPQITTNNDTQALFDDTDIFTSREHALTIEQTNVITELCRQNGVSLASFTASVYSDILNLWSGQEQFTINFPRFNRNLEWHPNVNHMLGEFASFSLLEIDHNTENNFLERTQALQARMWEDIEHAGVSGVRVLRERILETGQPEMQAMPIVFTAMPERRGEQGELEESLATLGRLVTNKGATPQVWLDCQYYFFNDRLQLKWDSRDYLYPQGMIDDMFTEFIRVLESLTQKQSWSEIHLAFAPKRQMDLRKTQNSIQAPLRGGNVFQLFADRAREQSSAPAIVAEETTISYGELYSLSLTIGTNLRNILEQAPQQNTTPCVAIMLEKGWQQIASVMGIIASDLPYLPLDPETPSERLRMMIATANPLVIITQQSLESHCRSANGKTLLFDKISRKTNALPLVSGPKQLADNPAYLIFTSGSTGVPKCVTVGHEALLNLTQYSNQLFELSSKDAVFGITALHHDLSVYDVFGTLTAGAKLVLPSKAKNFQPEEWVRLLNRENVTFWNSVPMFMERLLEHCIREGQSVPLESIVLGGDWVDPNIVYRLPLSAPQAQLYTIGGPTETTVWNVINRVEGWLEGWETLPYGRPITNASYYILSADLQDAPDWVTGEMYCGGIPLCLSASLDPDENAKAFAVHPRTGEKIYRTGDMGRFRSTGLLEIKGRRDFQLNLNGYRMNPGEVEQTLVKHPNVQRAVVIASGVSSKEKDSNKTLVGFIVPAGNVDTSALERQLREWSNAHLPAPMRPRKIIFIHALPLTGNGKVDRKGLAALSASDVPQENSDQRLAQTPVETFLTEVWEEILQAQIPGVRSSFFELGGDSLQATRVFARVKEKLGVTMPLSQIFTTPTIEGLAEALLGSIALITKPQRDNTVTGQNDNVMASNG